MKQRPVNPSRSAADPLADVLAELEHQAHLANRLATIAREQSAALAEAGGDGLLEVIADRQRLIDEMLAVQARIDPLLNEIEHMDGDVGPELRDRAAALIVTIGQSLDDIAACDAGTRTEVEGRLQQLREERQTNTSARRASEAYHSRPLNTPQTRFTDRKG